MAQEPGAPVLDDLGGGPLREGEDRRPAGQRLQHDQPEGLVPADGEQQGAGSGQELELAGVVHLTLVHEAVVEIGEHVALVVGDLGRLPHLGRHDEGDVGLEGGLHGPVGSLVRCHAPQEEDVAAVAPAHRELAGLDAVVDDPGDGNLWCHPTLVVGDGDDPGPAGGVLIDVDELVGELAVDGRHHGRIGVAGRVDGSGHGVVMDHVEVAGVVEGPDHVAQLGHGRPDAVVLGLGDLPAPLDRAGRVAGRVEHDVVAGGGVTPGQEVDHQLDSAVETGGNRGPGRRDHGDAHGSSEPRPGRAVVRATGDRIGGFRGRMAQLVRAQPSHG